MDQIPTRRLFLAASAEPLQKSLAPWLKKMKIGADRKELTMRWTPPELLHITLMFFGECTEEQQGLISEAARDVTTQIPAFQLKIEDTGAFPELRSGRVVWFGVQNSRKWRALHDELATRLAPQGFALEGAHVPHLTVGRMKSPRSLTDYMSPFERVKIGKLPVTEIVLYESILAGAFPVYRVIERFPLTGLQEDLNEVEPVPAIA